MITFRFFRTIRSLVCSRTSLKQVHSFNKTLLVGPVGKKLMGNSSMLLFMFLDCISFYIPVYRSSKKTKNRENKRN